MMFIKLCVLFFFALFASRAASDSTSKRTTRYFLYTVNPGEGFNLRRDVHLRAATLVKELRKKDDSWILVLPPWPHLYHWKSPFTQDGIKWERFFDLKSLNEYVPTIEYEDYLTEEGHIIDKVVHLQHFAEGWGEEGFRERYEQRPCIDPTRYKKIRKGVWQGSVYMLGGTLEMKSFQCVSVMGFTTTLLPLLKPSNGKDPPRSVLMERLETVMQADFGGLEYWAARYSMVYAQDLRETGSQFMKSQLDYDPGSGNGRQAPNEGGGAFLSVHLRRRDYIHAHPDKVPTLKDAAKQINSLLTENHLDRVFLCSDAPLEEKKDLQRLVHGLVWYEPSEEELHQFGDGGIAIIDQWIAAHAKFFVGTAESTYSFRIRDDRQLMKFSVASTFNQLCGTEGGSCEKPSVWRINEGVWSLFTNKLPHHSDEL